MITRPVQRGELQLAAGEKEAMESLLEHVFRNVLQVEQEANRISMKFK